jgi:hypothetical protein
MKIKIMKKRILFLVHTAEFFSSFELILNQFLLDKENFECFVVVGPQDYTGKSKSFSGSQKVFDFLTQNEINSIKLEENEVHDTTILQKINPDYIFRQTPWDHLIPPSFRIGNLPKAKICYVPYAEMIIDTGDAQYNQPFHHACSFIFADNLFHFNEYKKYQDKDTQRIHLVGSTRYEKFSQFITKNEKNHWPINIPKGTPKIIWAPHHCYDPNWIGAATFLENKNLFLEYASRKDVSIIFRPHPALIDKLISSGTISIDEYDEWLSAFESSPYSRCDTEIDYIGLMCASDYMITDGISFLEEYLVTKKPLIRTISKNVKRMNEHGEKLVNLHRPCHDTLSLNQVLNEIVTSTYIDSTHLNRCIYQQELLDSSENSSFKIYSIIKNDSI